MSQDRQRRELAGPAPPKNTNEKLHCGKPDVQSRYSEHRPTKGGSKDQPITTILRPSHFSGRISTAGPTIPYANWQSIAIDFITDLPRSERYDQLWVIVNRFTKMGYFLPLPKDYRLSDI
jgi:hypothetical protein